MFQCIRLKRSWKLAVAVSFFVLSITAPLLAPTGWCLTCDDILCRDPCTRGSYAGVWSDCETCWVLLNNHACTACGWYRYQCIPPSSYPPYRCHPPYQWELQYFDNPAPFPVPGVVWYTCRVVGGWRRCR